MARTLLLEIGVEELPASFVAAALGALPELLKTQLAAVRVDVGAVRALGTPRRLALLVSDVAEQQRGLDEQVLGPPVKVAYDAERRPTRAALNFAEKIGCGVDSLVIVQTPKGDYIAGQRVEAGLATSALLADVLGQVCAQITFRKSMRWGDLDTTFGRPVRWLVALFGDAVVPVNFGGVTAGRTTYGHRFRAPGAVQLDSPDSYVETLRRVHVLADPAERRAVMLERLHEAARNIGGQLIDDEFLMSENASLVEEPAIIAGSFDEHFLELPERVILDVAKGHQFYFGVRDAAGKLLPRYLAVVGTALKPENVQRGNNRVMRARLADAKFFFEEDLKRPLDARLAKLDGIVFQKRLGTIGDKVRRMEGLIPLLAEQLHLSARVCDDALSAVVLAKCDLTTFMVGEFPELQGEMGRVYALAAGVPAGVADVIREHYQPRGADDALPGSDAGSLVALADRLDTLTGCFAVGLVPKGTADPLALRRAAIGLLRILVGRRYDLSLRRALEAAFAQFQGVKLDLTRDATLEKLDAFFHDRLRGVLTEPGDVVDACIAAGHDRPFDLCLRAQALAEIAIATRETAGEVFKRAANIAKDAPAGEPEAPTKFSADVHPSESKVFASFALLEGVLRAAGERQEYRQALAAIAEFAPVLAKFFEDVFVMVDDVAVRENRLRLMRALQEQCSTFANFKLLAKA